LSCSYAVSRPASVIGLWVTCLWMLCFHVKNRGSRKWNYLSCCCTYVLQESIFQWSQWKYVTFFWQSKRFTILVSWTLWDIFHIGMFVLWKLYRLLLGTWMMCRNLSRNNLTGLIPDNLSQLLSLTLL
jgi:hypothetical protein